MPEEILENYTVANIRPSVIAIIFLSISWLITWLAKHDFDINTIKVYVCKAVKSSDFIFKSFIVFNSLNKFKVLWQLNKRKYFRTNLCQVHALFHFVLRDFFLSFFVRFSQIFIVLTWVLSKVLLFKNKKICNKIFTSENAYIEYRDKMLDDFWEFCLF